MSMLRQCFGLIVGICLLVNPVVAAPTAAELSRVLKLDEVTEILREEGNAYAASVADSMLPGGGGQLWDLTVARLYDPAVMQDVLTKALAEGMTEAELDDAIGFFGSEDGQSILTYENAARQAMAEPEIEALARENYVDLRQQETARILQLDRFVEINDLLERNVAGALSSNYRFLRGLADGGGVDTPDGDIISDVWAQEDEIRAETKAWVYGFLLLAYQPLSDEVFESYIAFSETESGQAMNVALFDGFEKLYSDIFYALGLATAQAMSGSDL